MPRKGYKTVTIKDEIFFSLQKQAEKNNRTLPQQIAHLVNKKGVKKNVRT